MALPSLLHNELRQTLMDNGPFDSNEELRGVFADPRLSQWRHSVPEATNRASRVNFTIAKLLDDWTVNGENALYLFLVVLSEQMGKPGFVDLAERVRVVTIQDKITASQQELKQIAEHLERGWSDAAYANSRRAKVEEELRQWEARVKATPAPTPVSPGGAQPGSGKSDDETPVVEAAVGANETYTDIEIHILGRANDVYPVSAKLSDGSSFLDKLLLDRGALLAVERDPEAYSECLSRALFVGNIDKAYFKAQTLAEDNTQERLRLRLWIDNTAAELQVLRWEHLRYWRDNEPYRLAATADHPFSRYFGLGQADPEPLTTKTIRILVVIANPRDLPEYNLTPLAYETEILNVFKAYKDVSSTNVTLTLLPGQSAISDALRQRLTDAGIILETGSASFDRLLELLGHQPDYHILHFFGHGGYNQRHKQFGLFFEDEMGHVEQVRERELAVGLQEAGRLPRLIFLAACESAKRLPEIANPFVGIAPRLIQAGVPAVVAMQDAISISLANRLTRTFYRSLFECGMVDKAMNRARSAIARENVLESATPVLFTRLKSGRLFS